MDKYEEAPFKKLLKSQCSTLLPVDTKQSAATRAKSRTNRTVALSLGVDLKSVDARHMNCTPAFLLPPDEEIYDEEHNVLSKSPPMSFTCFAHCQTVDKINEAVLPKDVEKDDDDNEDEYNGVAHLAFELKQSLATRARERTNITVAWSRAESLVEVDHAIVRGGFSSE